MESYTKLQDFITKLTYVMESRHFDISWLKERLSKYIDTSPFDIIFDYENQSMPIHMKIRDFVQHINDNIGKEESESISSFIYNRFISNGKTYSISHAYGWNDWEDDVDVYRRYLYGDNKKFGLINMLGDRDKLKRSIEATLEYAWNLYDEIYDDLYEEDIDMVILTKKETIDVVYKFLEKYDLVSQLGIQLREE